ncbi:MAG: tyrosine-type recombinase/integrase [Actinomycetota bacterium]|nr:tyrosine-type recombinase/integrase [Actinomycetota bacterium]
MSIDVSDEMLVEAIFDGWLNSPGMDRLSSATRRRSRALLLRFAQWGDGPLLAATAGDVDRWLTEQEITAATRRIYLHSFKLFFEWAREMELRFDDPVAALVEAARHRPRAVRAPRVIQDVVEEPEPEDRRCACGSTASELRRLSREGPPLCPTCYQRARRQGEAGAKANGDAFYAELVGAGLAPKTVRIYLNTVSSAQRWFAEQGWSLASATAQQVASYASTLPQSWASLKGLRSALIRYWSLTAHPRPPVRAIRVPPKPQMLCNALDERDAQILARAARGRGDLKGLAVMLGMYQALRREEIATLQWAAFDEEGWMTLHGKNRKRRTIPLHRAVAEYLALLPRPDSYVFPGRFGGPSNPATIWEWVAELAEEAGVTGVRPHRLRHTALATQNDATGDLRTVQAFAGHSNPSTTAGYTRASRRRLQEAVAAIDY